MARNKKRKFNKSGAPKLTEAEKLAKRQERGTANHRVAARREMFRHFRGDGAIGHEMTCAGRLMIVGAFDGLEVAAETILSALLDYSGAYWGNFGGGPQVAENGKMRVDGSPPPVVGVIDPETGKLKDRAGEWFKVRDDILRSAGAASRQAVHNITVDRHWFPDDDCDWAERIINYRLLAKRAELVRAGRDVSLFRIDGDYKPSESDYAMLALARHGALALCADRKKLAA